MKRYPLLITKHLALNLLYLKQLRYLTQIFLPRITHPSKKFFPTALLIVIYYCFFLLLPATASAGWEQVMNAAPNLSEGAQKKRAEINQRVAMDDKKVKEALDKIFKDQFEKVFEGDLKPSQVYDVFQFVEAASAGDLDAAMKTGGEFMVGLIPGVGQYISAMKSLAKGIRMAEQIWIDELYRTDAYNNLFSIVNPALRENFYSDSFRPPEPFSRSYGGAPYIPSFLIRYAPNAPEAAIMGRLQAHMQRWEASMYERWRTVDSGRPVTQLQQPPWAAKLRSAYGKVLTDQEIFNRFLYRIVEPDRNKILENLRWIYLRPAAMKAAQQEKQKINATVEQALAKISFDDGKESLPVLKPVRDVEKGDPRRQPNKMTTIDSPSPGTSKTDRVVSSGPSISQPAPLQGKFWVMENISYSTGVWRDGNHNLIYYIENSPVKPTRGKLAWGPGTEEDARKASKRMLEDFENRRIWWVSVRGDGSYWIHYEASGRKPEQREIGWGPGNRADAQRALERFTTGQKTESDTGKGGVAQKAAKSPADGEARWIKIVDEVLADAVHPDFSAQFSQNVQKTRQNMLASKSVDHQKLSGMTPSQLAAYTRETKGRFAKTIYDQFMGHPYNPLGETSVRHLLAKGLISQAQVDAYLKKNAKKESKKEIYTRLAALRDRMTPEIRKLDGDISGYNYSIKNLNSDLKQAAPGLRQLRDLLQSQPVKQRSASDVSRYNSGRMAYNQKLTQRNQLADQIKELKAKRNAMADLLKSIDSAWKAGNHRQALDIANNSPVAREYGWKTFNP